MNMVSLDLFRTPTGYLKIANVTCILIAVAVFFSKYQGWIQFISTTLVSGLVYITFLSITYILGGMAIQKTFYEIIMNCYFTVMFFAAAIVAFVNGNAGGVIVATGIFCLFSFFIFSADIYFALVNAGAFNRVAGSSPDPPGGPSIPPPTFTSSPPNIVYPTNASNPNAFSSGPATISPNY